MFSSKLFLYDNHLFYKSFSCSKTFFFFSKQGYLIWSTILGDRSAK